MGAASAPAGRRRRARGRGAGAGVGVGRGRQGPGPARGLPRLPLGAGLLLLLAAAVGPAGARGGNANATAGLPAATRSSLACLDEVFALGGGEEVFLPTCASVLGGPPANPPQTRSANASAVEPTFRAACCVAAEQWLGSPCSLDPVVGAAVLEPFAERLRGLYALCGLPAPPRPPAAATLLDLLERLLPTAGANATLGPSLDALAARLEANVAAWGAAVGAGGAAAGLNSSSPPRREAEPPGAAEPEPAPQSWVDRHRTTLWVAGGCLGALAAGVALGLLATRWSQRRAGRGRSADGAVEEEEGWGPADEAVESAGRYSEGLAKITTMFSAGMIDPEEYALIQRRMNEEVARDFIESVVSPARAAAGRE